MLELTRVCLVYVWFACPFLLARLCLSRPLIAESMPTRIALHSAPRCALGGVGKEGQPQPRTSAKPAAERSFWCARVSTAATLMRMRSAQRAHPSALCTAKTEAQLKEAAGCKKGLQAEITFRRRTSCRPHRAVCTLPPAYARKRCIDYALPHRSPFLCC